LRKLWRLSALSVAVLLIAAIVVLAVVNRPRIDSLTGYYAPTFSPDGQSVLFLERRLKGISWGLGYEFFTGPAHSYVISDALRLRRLSLDDGEVTNLEELPDLPTVGRHLRAYRSRLYHFLAADLRFTQPASPDIRLRLSIPRVPRSEQFHLVRDGQGDASPSTDAWREGGASFFPTAAQRVRGTHELLVLPGSEAPPCGVQMLDHTNEIGRFLLGEEACRAVYPNGLSWETLLQRSRYASVKKSETLEDTRRKLMRRFLDRGMNEGEAAIAVIDEMRRLGLYPKPTTLTAQPISGDDLARWNERNWPLFYISPTEFRVGLFQDIARAIGRPGTGIEKSIGRYVIHRDFRTSELLNRHLESRPKGFLVETDGGLYAVTIDWR
jgi:hypothetical protein